MGTDAKPDLKKWTDEHRDVLVTIVVYGAATILLATACARDLTRQLAVVGGASAQVSTPSQEASP